MAKTSKTMDEIIKPMKELISAEDILDPSPNEQYVDDICEDQDYKNERYLYSKIRAINNLENGPKLKDTIDFMNNDSDYKSRFIAEYMQVKIRYNNLHNMMIKLDAGTLDFEPDCDRAILEDQCYYMGNYIRVLEIRAEIENIPLPRI